MTTTLYLTFDGGVFVPEQPVSLAPNTRVRATIEAVADEDEHGVPRSLLNAARSLNVDGPPDWSSRLDDYLYGERLAGEE